MLTDSQCRSAKCKDKPYKLADANGLYLEVKPNGVKAWRYRFKLTKAGETLDRSFHRRTVMPTLQAIHGRLVEVRRFTNVHLYVGRRPLGPTERYELWLKLDDGAARKFTIDTRTMPARRGHEVSLIVTGHQVPQVLGLDNWTTIDGVNYARTDAPPLVRVWDFVLLSAAFLTLAVLGGDIGMVLFVPAAVAYLLTAGLGRALVRTWRAAQVDRAIDAEARRMSRSPRAL